MNRSVLIQSSEMHCQRFYIQVMTVHENNPRVYVPLGKGIVVEIINVLDFLFMQSVVVLQIVFSGLTAISEDAFQHLVLVIYATLMKLVVGRHFVYIATRRQHMGPALSFYLLIKTL